MFKFKRTDKTTYSYTVQLILASPQYGNWEWNLWREQPSVYLAGGFCETRGHAVSEARRMARLDKRGKLKAYKMKQKRKNATYLEDYYRV